MFDWRKQYLEGRLGADKRGSTLLPVTLKEASESGVAESAGSTPATQAPGTIRIQLPHGDVHVEGHVDPEMLRVVIQCLNRKRRGTFPPFSSSGNHFGIGRENSLGNA